MAPSAGGAAPSGRVEVTDVSTRASAAAPRSLSAFASPLSWWLSHSCGTHTVKRYVHSPGSVTDSMWMPWSEHANNKLPPRHDQRCRYRAGSINHRHMQTHARSMQASPCPCGSSRSGPRNVGTCPSHHIAVHRHNARALVPRTAARAHCCSCSHARTRARTCPPSNWWMKYGWRCCVLWPPASNLRLPSASNFPRLQSAVTVPSGSRWNCRTCAWWHHSYVHHPCSHNTQDRSA